MIHFMCNFHQKLLTSNYKINNHGKNEIRHDHLKFIPVKEISFTVKTKHSRPKQIICFKNKFIAQGKNQSSGQQCLVKGHPSTWCITTQCVHNVDFRVSFCFPVTVFYERASEWQACTDSLCSVADSPRMTALELEFWSNKPILCTEIYLFCMVLSLVSNK